MPPARLCAAAKTLSIDGTVIWAPGEWLIIQPHMKPRQACVRSIHRAE